VVDLKELFHFWTDWPFLDPKNALTSAGSVVIFRMLTKRPHLFVCRGAIGDGLLVGRSLMALSLLKFNKLLFGRMVTKL